VPPFFFSSFSFLFYVSAHPRDSSTGQDVLRAQQRKPFLFFFLSSSPRFLICRDRSFPQHPRKVGKRHFEFRSLFFPSLFSFTFSPEDGRATRACPPRHESAGGFFSFFSPPPVPCRSAGVEEPLRPSERDVLFFILPLLFPPVPSATARTRDDATPQTTEKRKTLFLFSPFSRCVLASPCERTDDEAGEFRDGVSEGAVHGSEATPFSFPFFLPFHSP